MLVENLGEIVVYVDGRVGLEPGQRAKVSRARPIHSGGAIETHVRNGCAVVDRVEQRERNSVDSAGNVPVRTAKRGA